MDVLIVDNVVHELFPNGAPDLHPDLLVVTNVPSNVEERWTYNPDDGTFAVPVYDDDFDPGEPSDE